MKTKFSIRLKELREDRGLSQRQLSEQVKLNQANISRWEKGTQKPTSDCIILLAKFFGVTTDYLLGVSDE